MKSEEYRKLPEFKKIQATLAEKYLAFEKEFKEVREKFPLDDGSWNINCYGELMVIFSYDEDEDNSKDEDKEF